MSDSRAPSAARLAALRAKLQTFEETSDRGSLTTPLLTPGIPRGTLVELTGPTRTEWLCSFLKEHPTLQVCWLETSLSLLPTAIEQRGAVLSRFLFVETKSTDALQLFKPLRQAIRSQVFDLLICPSIFEHDRVLKALQLLIEKSNAILFLLGTQPRSAWPISVQIDCPVGKAAHVLKFKKTRLAVEVTP